MLGSGRKRGGGGRGKGGGLLGEHLVARSVAVSPGDPSDGSPDEEEDDRRGYADVVAVEEDLPAARVEARAEYGGGG